MYPASSSRQESLLSEDSAALPQEVATEGDRTAQSAGRRASRTGLGVVSVLALVFFNVSGGPLGSETIISSAGPIAGLSAIGIFVAVFSLPQAMITAELSTAFPENGGYSLWVHAAFGDFWAVQESYWSWFSGVVDSVRAQLVRKTMLRPITLPVSICAPLSCASGTLMSASTFTPAGALPCAHV